MTKLESQKHLDFRICNLVFTLLLEAQTFEIFKEKEEFEVRTSLINLMINNSQTCVCPTCFS